MTVGDTGIGKRDEVTVSLRTSRLIDSRVQLERLAFIRRAIAVFGEEGLPMGRCRRKRDHSVAGLVKHGEYFARRSKDVDPLDRQIFGASFRNVWVNCLQVRFSLP